MNLVRIASLFCWVGKPTMFNANGKIMASPWEFKNYKECGLCMAA